MSRWGGNFLPEVLFYLNDLKTPTYRHQIKNIIYHVQFEKILYSMKVSTKKQPFYSKYLTEYTSLFICQHIISVVIMWVCLCVLKRVGLLLLLFMVNYIHCFLSVILVDKNVSAKTSAVYSRDSSQGR